MASKKAKGEATKAPPSPSFAPRRMTTLRFAILQEKDVAVAVAQAMSPSAPTWAPAFEAAHVQRADARAAGYNLICVFI